MAPCGGAERAGSTRARARARARRRPTRSARRTDPPRLAYAQRGRSSVVERQVTTLDMRVRFPPPASPRGRENGRMRVSLMIEGQQGVTWEQWVALARACEENGIERLFRSDHYLGFHAGGRDGSLDCWTTLAALAAVTSTLRLGSLVSPVTFRHPSLLARAAVTVDHVSGGRVEVGIGGGWMEAEHRAFGFPFPDTSARMESLAEQLEIVHRQWTEDGFDFSGEHYALKDGTALPRPGQQADPPLV